MIKARAENLIIFGLESENIDRMITKRNPIMIKLKDLGEDLPDLDIVIIAGSKEQMTSELRPFMSSSTKVIDETKRNKKD